MSNVLKTFKQNAKGII